MICLASHQDHDRAVCGGALCWLECMAKVLALVAEKQVRFYTVDPDTGAIVAKIGQLFQQISCAGSLSLLQGPLERSKYNLPSA